MQFGPTETDYALLQNSIPAYQVVVTAGFQQVSPQNVYPSVPLWLRQIVLTLVCPAYGLPDPRLQFEICSKIFFT